MITALEASMKSDAVLDGRLDEELDPVYKQIELACDKGKKEVFLDKPLRLALSGRLEEIGYKVDVFHDAFNGWSKITWE